MIQAASRQAIRMQHRPVKGAAKARTEKRGTACRGLVPDLSESRKGNSAVFVSGQLSVVSR